MAYTLHTPLGDIHCATRAQLDAAMNATTFTEGAIWWERTNGGGLEGAKRGGRARHLRPITTNKTRESP